MTTLPAALEEALRPPAHRSTAAPARIASSRVRPGDLRFANGLPGESVEPRLILVLSVDDQLEFADVLLLHTAPEMACDVDLVVPTSVSGAPYDVVVETDLRGVIWTIQLGSAVGHVGGALRTLRPDSTTSDGAFRSDVHSGPQLAGPTDPRWNFKRDEGVALRALARDCTDALLDDEAWQVEAGLLRPDLLDLADDPVALMAELVHWLQTRRLELTPADAEVLLEMGALDTDAWGMFGDLGLDISTAVQSLVEAAATGSPQSAGRSTSSRLVTATHIESGQQGPRPQSIRYLGQKELVSV